MIYEQSKCSFIHIFCNQASFYSNIAEVNEVNDGYDISTMPGTANEALEMELVAEVLMRSYFRVATWICLICNYGGRYKPDFITK